MSSQTLADMAVKITSVINRHLAEENCVHKIHEIAMEIFDNNTGGGPTANKATTTDRTGTETNSKVQLRNGNYST